MRDPNVLRAARVMSLAVFVAGGALTGRAAYMQAKAELAGMLIRRAWTEQVQTGVAVKPWGSADMHPVARLRIPRIEYDEYVLDNATPRTLAFGPGVIGNGTVLGEDGNLAIAGHRTSWFLPLRNVMVGDRVVLEWFDAKSKKVREKQYVVARIRVIDPAEASLLRATEADALTLVTCYPFGYGARSPQRFVVRAMPVTPIASSDNEPREEK